MTEYRCDYCGYKSEDGIEMHYHRHACWADDVRKRIASCDPEDTFKLRKLERELEMALYVGD